MKKAACAALKINGLSGTGYAQESIFKAFRDTAQHVTLSAAIAETHKLSGFRLRARYQRRDCLPCDVYRAIGHAFDVTRSFLPFLKCHILNPFPER